MRIFFIATLLCIIATLNGCQSKQKLQLVGKWNYGVRNDWFVFSQNNLYATGRDTITLFDSLQFELNEKEQKIKLFTDKSGANFYTLIYRFDAKNNQKLFIKNSMVAGMETAMWKSK
jgi:hypothetical protein